MMHTYTYTSVGDFNWLFIVLFIASVWVYFFPTLLAIYREHKNVGWIFLINLLFGGTGLGWLAALIWAITGETKMSEGIIMKSQSKAAELEKMHHLLKEGAITQEEYEKAKKKIFR